MKLQKRKVLSKTMKTENFQKIIKKDLHYKKGYAIVNKPLWMVKAVLGVDRQERG